MCVAFPSKISHSIFGNAYYRIIIRLISGQASDVLQCAIFPLCNDPELYRLIALIKNEFTRFAVQLL